MAAKRRFRGLPNSNVSTATKVSMLLGFLWTRTGGRWSSHLSRRQEYRTVLCSAMIQSRMLPESETCLILSFSTKRAASLPLTLRWLTGTALKKTFNSCWRRNDSATGRVGWHTFSVQHLLPHRGRVPHPSRVLYD